MLEEFGTLSSQAEMLANVQHSPELVGKLALGRKQAHLAVDLKPVMKLSFCSLSPAAHFSIA